EDERQKLGADPFAGVADHDPAAVTFFRHAHGDAAGARCELYRVRQKVPEDLAKATSVPTYATARGDHDVEMEPFARTLRPRAFDRRLDDRRDRDELRLELERVRDDARDVEQVGDEPGEGMSVSFDRLDRALELARIERSASHHVDPPDDRVERCSKLVRE